jgi:predicted RNase H-like HicB family nuclease
MKYKVELIPTEEGFAVSCPELPGCWWQGNTEKEALENIKSAIDDGPAAADEVNDRKQTRCVEVMAY